MYRRVGPVGVGVGVSVVECGLRLSGLLLAVEFRVRSVGPSLSVCPLVTNVNSDKHGRLDRDLRLG